MTTNFKCCKYENTFYKKKLKLYCIGDNVLMRCDAYRYNLDPESRHSEPEIWRSLEIAQLMPLICSLQGRLDATVSEGGENFSIGQRQVSVNYLKQF